MKQSQTLDPQRIAIMEAMMLRVVAIQRRLDEYATEYPRYLAGYTSTEITHEHDVLITESRGEFVVTVAMPGDKIPTLQSFPDNPVGDEQQLEWFIDGLRIRKSLIERIIKHLIGEYPSFPTGGLSQFTTMSDIANACDIPIIDVSRLIFDKSIQTPVGSIQFADVVKRNPNPGM